MHNNTASFVSIHAHTHYPYVSRDVVYKNGIRTTEFFEDHDKLRSGIITENQVKKK